jgi:arginine/lysine/histidine transporter system substrate-binding protein
MKKSITAIALLAALMMLFAGCATPTPAATAAAATAAPTVAPASNNNSVDAIKKRGELIVATNAAFQPFEYMDGDKVVGFDMDIAQAIADKLGVKLTINNMEFDAVLAAVPSGKADIGIAGMSVKPERQAVMDFSDSYFKSSIVMLVAKDNDALKTIDDLVGKKLGVQTGTVADTVVASGVKDATVVRMNKDADSVQDLINGKLDAVLLDSSPAQVFATQLSDKIKLIDTPLDLEDYAVAVNKGNSGLIEVINQVIKELRDSGKYDQLLAKYNLSEK